MLASALIDQTRERFPAFDDDRIEVLPLEKGGSDRKFYRIAVTRAHSLILVRYDDSREENRRYAEIATFLRSIDVNAPEIFLHDETERLIWMQDLGDCDLFLHRNAPWHVRARHYHAALGEALKLHARGIQKARGIKFEKEFDAELYRWEQNYFFEHCLGHFFGIDGHRRWLLLESAPLKELAQQLAERPRVLVHRDFQSQNVMLWDGQAWLIDFQGIRPGLAEYDLASLLYDPYVTLTPAQREELLGYYVDHSIDAGVPVPRDIRGTLDLCAAQRLMQALGAYGFLGLVKGRRDFLDHIPAALANLREVVARIPALGELRCLLETLR